MKAAVIHKFGGPEVLELMELPTPVPAPGHVLIKVLAATVNRLDHYIREGSVNPALSFPHVLGMDAAGEIAGLGQGVTGFKTGDRVIAMPGYAKDPADAAIRPATAAPSYSLPGLHLTGTYAQYITVPAAWVVHDTSGLPPEQSVSLPVTLLTAVRAVQIVGEVKAGQTVLVHAGASSTGLMSIQVAKALGAKVAGSVSAKTDLLVAGLAGGVLVAQVVGAMAGAIGAGGLGDIAYRYGYQRFDSQIMLTVIAMLVALVALIQLGGDRLAKGLNKR